MPFNVKGITVEIDGDATKLTDALKQVEREYSNLDKNARDLKNAIKLSGSEAGLDSYRTALKLTEEQVSRTAEKTDLLKQAIDNHGQAVANWKSRLSEVQAQMKGLDTQIQNGKSALQIFTEQHTQTTSQLAKAKEAYQSTTDELGDYRSALTKVESEETKLQSALKKEVDNHDKLQNALSRSAQSELDLERQASNLRQQMLLQQQTVNDNKRNFLEAQEALEQFRTSEEATTEEIAEMEQAVYKLEVKWKSSELALSKQSAQLDKVNTKLKECKATQESYKTALAESENKMSQYRTELEQVASKKEQLKQRIDELTQKQQEQKRVMDETQAAYDNEEAGIKLLSDEIKKLETEYSKLATEEKTLQANLENEQKTLMTLEAQYQKNIEKLKQYKNELLELATASEAGGLYGAGQRLSESLQSTGQMLEALGRNTRVLSAAAATGLTYAVKTANDVESAFVGVQKTVEATPEQFEAINQGLWDIAKSTGTAYEEVAKFGELGGQLGIAQEDIVDFANTVTMLSDTTNIVGEEGAASMAKFANLMREEFKSVQADTHDWYARYGSTIVDLGNNFATTEADIQAMSTRLAAAATQAGMTTPEILALSTTLSSMGLKTDEAGSTMSKFIQKIQLAVETGSDDVEKFAEIAGMSAQDFARAWNEDASNALLSFIEGLSVCDEGSTTLQKLADAGLNTEIRMTRALGGLANGHELYAQAINTATNAWRENSAMQAEAEKRYATTERAIASAKESIKQAASALGDTMRPAVEKACDAVKKACDWFIKLDEGSKTTVAGIGAIAAAFSPVMTVMGKFTSGIGSMIGKFTDLNDGAGRVAKALGIYDKAVNATLGSHSSFMSALGKVSDATKDAAESSDDLVDAIKKIDDKTGETSVSVAGLAKAMISWKTVAVAGMVAGAFAIGDAINQANKAIQDHAAEVTKATSEELKAWNEVSEAVNKYTEYAQQSLDSAENILASYDEQEAKTQALISTIGQLIDQEGLSVSEKERLASAIQALNGLYPELGLYIDEETGKLTDATGKTYENAAALDKLGQSLLDTAQKQAYFNALVEAMTALNQAGNGLDQVRDKYINLQTEVRNAREELDGLYKATQEGQRVNNERVRELEGQLKVLGPAAREAGEAFMTAIDQYSEAYALILDTLSKSDWDGFLTKLSELETAAINTGLKIPESISTGIRDGSVSASDAVAYMQQVMTLTQLVDESGLIGGAIPVEVANGIISNAGSVDEAIAVLEQLVQFSEAVQTAGEGGEGIAAELAQGIASGEITVEEAIASLNSLFELNKAYEKMSGDLDSIETYLNGKLDTFQAKTKDSYDGMNETIKESGDEAVRDSKDAADKVTQAWEDQAGPMSSASKTLGDNAKEGVQSGTEQAVQVAVQGALDVVKAFSDRAGDAQTAGNTLAEGAHTGVSNKMAEIITMTGQKSNEIVNAIRSGQGGSAAAGTDLVSPASASITSIMSSAAGTVASWCSNIINNIANAVAYARNNPVVTRNTTINETISVSTNLTHSSKAAPQTETAAFTRAGFAALNPLSSVNLAETFAATKADTVDIHNPYLDSGVPIDPVKSVNRGSNTEVTSAVIDYAKLGMAVKEAIGTLDFNINTQLNGQTLVAETARLMDRELARRGGRR